MATKTDNQSTHCNDNSSLNGKLYCYRDGNNDYNRYHDGNNTI